MLKKGIYEHVINQITKQHIHEIEQQGMVCMRQNIDEAESPQILANYLGKVIRQKLEEIENQEDRVNLINNILKEAGIIDEIQITSTITSRKSHTNYSSHLWLSRKQSVYGR